MRRIGLLLPLLCVAAFAADQPRPDLKLTLSLSKARWHVGEYLWYRLKICNQGTARFLTRDTFWKNHLVVNFNLVSHYGTILEVFDERSRTIKLRESPYTQRSWWTDDQAYAETSPNGNLILEPGQILSTSATIPRPDAPKTSPPPQQLTASKHPIRIVERPVGFRIWEARWIGQPGHYRIRARLDECPRLLNENGGFSHDQDNAADRARREEASREPEVHSLSNTVEFDVVP